MTEARAVMLAGAAHLALLLGLSLSWAWASRDLPQIVESVPVEIVDISDLPRVTALPKPSMDAAPQETVEDAAPEPAPDKLAPPPPPVLADIPAPEPKPVPESAKAKKVAPKKFEAQELSNLLDKSLPKAKVKPVDVSAFAKSIEKSLPKGAQIDTRATATLAQAIGQQVRPCWNLPMGGKDVASINTVLHIRFAKTGAVVGQPEVVSQSGVTAANLSYAKPMADAAKRAVLRCAPLRLPPEMYDLWQDIEFNFDPSKLV